MSDLAVATTGEKDESFGFSSSRMAVESLEGMAAILEGEAQAYTDLVEWAAKKRTALLETKLEALEEAIRAEQLLIWQVNRFERRRLSLEEEMATAVVKRDGTVPPTKQRTLRYWISSSPEHIARRLEEVRVKLLALADALRHVNELNAVLVKQGLAYLEFSFEVLRGSSGSGLYCSSGELKKVAAASHFSRRI